MTAPCHRTGKIDKLPAASFDEIKSNPAPGGKPTIVTNRDQNLLNFILRGLSMRECTQCHNEFQDWVSACLVCSGPLTPRQVQESASRPNPFEMKELVSQAAANRENQASN